MPSGLPGFPGESTTNLCLCILRRAYLAQDSKVFHISYRKPALKPGSPPVRPSTALSHFREPVSCVSDISHGCGETRRGSHLGEKGFTLAYGLRVYCHCARESSLTSGGIRKGREDQKQVQDINAKATPHSDRILQLSPTSRWCHRSPSPSHHPQTKCSNKQMSRLGHFTSKPNDHRD